MREESTHDVEERRTPSMITWASGWNPEPTTATTEPAGNSPPPGTTSAMETAGGATVEYRSSGTQALAWEAETLPWEAPSDAPPPDVTLTIASAGDSSATATVTATVQSEGEASGGATVRITAEPPSIRAVPPASNVPSSATPTRPTSGPSWSRMIGVGSLGSAGGTLTWSTRPGDTCTQ